jgi:hypothetical protein
MRYPTLMPISLRACLQMLTGILGTQKERRGTTPPPQLKTATFQAYFSSEYRKVLPSHWPFGGDSNCAGSTAEAEVPLFDGKYFII